MHPQPTTCRIQVGNDLFAIIDSEDYDLVSRWRWKLSRGYVASNRYFWGRQVMVRLHRLLLLPDPGLVVDHINGDPLDNRRCNLRVVTNAQNTRARHMTHGASKYLGVCKARDKWRARLMLDGRSLSLGHFRTEEDAARAYDDAAAELFGEYAHLNFPG